LPLSATSSAWRTRLVFGYRQDSYARLLRERGHQVAAVDLSPEMIERACASAPDVEFKREASKHSRLRTSSSISSVWACFDSYARNIWSDFGNAARLKVGGSAVIADHHPMAGFLGGSAIFQDKERYHRNVKSFVHTHSEYISRHSSSQASKYGRQWKQWSRSSTREPAPKPSRI
jgi:hypothetical protein